MGRLWLPSRARVSSDRDHLVAPDLRYTLPSHIGQRVSVACTAGASNVKGAWVEAIASTPVDGHILFFGLGSGNSQTGANSCTLADVSFGAAGDEDNNIVFNNLACGYSNTTYVLAIPIWIPAGTRISCRTQAFTGGRGTTLTVAIGETIQIPKGNIKEVRDPIISYVGNVAASKGTSLVAGAWTTIATTTQRHKGFLFSKQGDGDTGLFAATEVIKFAIGTVGNEVELGVEYRFDMATTEAIFPSSNSGLEFAAGSSALYLPIFIDMPVGTRIACHWTQGNASNSMDVSVYGF